MAPATIAGLKPITVPIPMKATPMVAIVLHDEPVNTDITPHTAHVSTRKKRGLRKERP